MVTRLSVISCLCREMAAAVAVINKYIVIDFRYGGVWLMFLFCFYVVVFLIFEDRKCMSKSGIYRGIVMRVLKEDECVREKERSGR